MSGTLEIGALVRISGDPRKGVVVDRADGRWAVAPLLPASEAASATFAVRAEETGLAGLFPAGFAAADVGGLLWIGGESLTAEGDVPPALADRLLRARCEAAVRAYHRHRHASAGDGPVTSVPVSGRVYGAEEMVALTESALDFWLTTGRFNDAFEAALGRFLGLRFAHTVNSGSSANLVAVTALTSPKLGERRLKPGDEVLTVAAGFPTTVNPILQNGLVPVFTDVELPTYNVDPARIESAIGPRTRAVVLAHTLGNPFDVAEVLRVAQKHGLWVVEDCCDALGSRFSLGGEARRCGTFGHVATFSFYPAHHITMGEGGAVATDDPELSRILVSVRDWGRDCWCPPGKDDTCRRRFDWKLGDLPAGYDHKYVYSHAGYNLKITDMQAAVGLAQMARLPGFIETRRKNFALLREEMADLEEAFLLPLATPGADPSWFGYPLTLRRGGGGRREELMRHLAASGVGTRLLFGGNLLRQPYFQGLPHRVSGPLDRTDRVMTDTFWIGCYPGLGPAHIRHSVESIRRWVRKG